jgi:hypothetical protein
MQKNIKMAVRHTWHENLRVGRARQFHLVRYVLGVAMDSCLDRRVAGTHGAYISTMRTGTREPASASGSSSSKNKGVSKVYLAIDDCSLYYQ